MSGKHFMAVLTVTCDGRQFTEHRLLRAKTKEVAEFMGDAVAASIYEVSEATETGYLAEEGTLHIQHAQMLELTAEAYALLRDVVPMFVPLD